MRTFKRNAVIITVVLFVCVAAYLNWSYGKSADDIDTIAEKPAASPPAVVLPEATIPSAAEENDPAPDAGLFYTPDDSDKSTASDIFAVSRINRQQARDAAAETLATVSSTEGASQEIIDAALVQISDIASIGMKEAELESLIMAKGYSDCVVFVSEDGVKVTVPAPMEGLSSVAVAQITDIITSQTQYKATDLNVIEAK